MSDRKFYVICSDDCLHESMTKEQIIAAIAEATGNVPTGIDDAFITKIKEMNENGTLQFWVGTEAEFNALSPAPVVNKCALRIGADGVIYVCSDEDIFANFVPITRTINGKPLSEDINFLPYELGAVKKLWSGSWSNGNITVPDWKKYSLYSLTLDGVNCPVLLIRYGSRIRGIGGDITATGLWTASISFAINDDDTWAYNFAGYIRHISASNHSEATNGCVVTGIWGIV